MLDDPHKRVTGVRTIFTEQWARQQRSDQRPEDAQPGVNLIPLQQDLLHIEIEDVELIQSVQRQALERFRRC